MKKLMLILLLTFTFIRCIAPITKQLYIFQSPDAIIILNWSNVDFWLREYKVENISVVKAQIWLETGNLSSKFCQQNHNLFGMKLPRYRPTTAIGKLEGMAYYPTWVHSIEDYALWQKYFYTGGNYYDFLNGRGYAEDPYYTWKLKRIIERL